MTPNNEFALSKVQIRPNQIVSPVHLDVVVRIYYVCIAKC